MEQSISVDVGKSLTDPASRFQKRYRHEQKYVIDERDLVLLENRLKPIMSLDRHNQNGAYQISSVYFDDYKDSALMENLSGVSPRSKYRMRIYDRNAKNIFLERKTKNYDMTYKESSPLTQEEAEEFLSGMYDLYTVSDSRLIQQFKADATMKRILPKVIVIYERLAYVCREGNVRITFDQNLAVSTQIQNFLSGGPLAKRPIMPTGKHILEVKYDEFLPAYIKKALNTGKMERTTYSKYLFCRKFSQKM